MARSLTPFSFGGLPPRRTGGDPFLELHREMNRLFDDVFRGVPAGGQGGPSAAPMMTPHMDVTETEREVRVCAELPGVSQDQVEVSLDDDILTIRGEKRGESRHEKENYHVMERSFGSFQRSLRVPFRIDPARVQATFENGVLTVTLPKPNQAQGSRKIEVRSSGQGGSGGQASSGGEATGGQGTAGQEPQDEPSSGGHASGP